MKHTPGPWTAEARESSWRVVAADGSTCRGIAEEANARLIAAAPEMYEALRGLRLAHGDMEAMLTAMPPVYAILARIEGE